jgi:hypothetical protein
LTLRWSGLNELTIQCQDCKITKDIVETQKYSYGNTAIRYVDFPGE